MMRSMLRTLGHAEHDTIEENANNSSVRDVPIPSAGGKCGQSHSSTIRGMRTNLIFNLRVYTCWVRMIRLGFLVLHALGVN